MTAPQVAIAPRARRRRARPARFDDELADFLILWSTVTVVIAAAVAVGYISYQHAVSVVRAAGETGVSVYLYPATIDGLFFVASMLLLNAARRGITGWRDLWLPYVLLSAGILATTGANLAAGWAHGPLGWIVYGWPGPVLVGIYEALMLLIRQLAADAKPAAPDARVAAHDAMLASIAGGNPLSARRLAALTGLPRDEAGEIVKEHTAAMNGAGSDG